VNNKKLPVDVRLLSRHAQRSEQNGAGWQFPSGPVLSASNVIELNLPPLRLESATFPQLTNHLLSKLAAANGIPTPKLSTAALASLETIFTFPAMSESWKISWNGHWRCTKATS